MSTTPRDELAQIITAHIDCDVWGPTMSCGMRYPAPDPLTFGRSEHLAQVLLAAGWRLPTRTVSTVGTVEELEEFQDRAVISEASGRVAVCLGHRYSNVAGNVWSVEGGAWLLSAQIQLPATVLSEVPSAGRDDPARCVSCGCELRYPSAVHIVDCQHGGRP